ncbi:MAG: hypothetical protein ACP6IY_16270 [Promethearchaeia archaeon]
MKITKKGFRIFLYGAFFILIILITQNSYVLANTTAPGVEGNPPKRSNINWEYKVKRPWFYKPSPYGDDFGSWIPTCIGVVIKTDFEYDAFLDGPDIPWVSKKNYIKEMNLEVEEVISYEPLIYLESESWYDHKITIQTLTSEEVKLQFDLKMGIKSKSAAASIDGGHSVSTITTSIISWSVTASGGEKKVVYIRMIFLHVKGTIKYYNNEVRSYDILIAEAIEFINIVVINNGNEKPVFDIKYYDGKDSNSNPDEFYGLGDKLIWINSEQKTISNYVGLKLNLGEKTGFFLEGKGKITYSTTNKFVVQHEFINKGMPDNIHFYLAFYNFYSVNLVPFIFVDPNEGGGGGGGSPPLLQ